MRTKDPTRKDDFISISGSKMRKLAALGAKPCPQTIPSDLIAAKCIPPGFMVEKGWTVVSDYCPPRRHHEAHPLPYRASRVLPTSPCHHRAQTSDRNRAIGSPTRSSSVASLSLPMCASPPSDPSAKLLSLHTLSVQTA